MPLSEESKKVLMDLAKAGVNADLINQLGASLNTNVNADNIVKGGVMRQQTFSSYMQNIDKKVDEKVKERLGEFAGIRDTLAQLKKDSPEYKALLQTHDQLKTQLINDNYNEEEINKLTLKTKSGLETLIKLAEIDIPTSTNTNTDTDIDLTGGNNMPNQNNNNNNYLTADDPRLVETFSGLALGAVNVQGDIQANLYEYERLTGQKASRDLVKQFTNAAVNGFANGKNVDDVANEVLKIGELTQTKNQEAENARLDQARKEGEAQAEKRMRELGLDVDKAKLRSNSNTQNQKRHLTSIISKTSTNPSGDADDRLNSGRDNSDNENDVASGIISKFSDSEFELPEAQRLRSLSPDKKLPIERRPLTAHEGRPMRIIRALNYVNEKNIDLTAD